MSDEVKLHKSEGVKANSQYLLGTIDAELANDEDHFNGANAGLLKHHGTYQQDDRDGRQGGGQKKFMFMVRTRIPGGRLNSQQMLAELDLCEELGNTTIRITSRQGLQLHGVVKQDLANVIGRINETQLTTLGACGDVNRNIMCCPAPIAGGIHDQLQELSQSLADHFAPRTSSYHDLWLTDTTTGEKTQVTNAEGTTGAEAATGADGTAGDEVEPIYGKTYLPRKFKMGICLPEDNCIDVYTHDLGMIAVVRDGKIIGVNMLVGGGQGVTPANKKTFAALGLKLAFVPWNEITDVATAIVKVQRDNGNRSDRKQARLKYLLDSWGVEAFRAKVAEYYGKPLQLPTEDDVTEAEDHIGWYPQGDGRFYYGLNVENGRVMDNQQTRIKSAIREICTRIAPGVRLTAHQSIIFTDLEEGQRDELMAILDEHQVVRSESISNARRWSMACVALPTCGLAITESERALPGIIDGIERELTDRGLEDEQFTIRMTGCPNGCARPYNSDIGLVGKSKGRYTVLVGGSRLGYRLNEIFRDQVPAEDVVSTLATLFDYFKDSREDKESFGDFCHRKGIEDLQANTAT
jgi:sulfite reductase (ferredoxin)